MRNKFLVGVFVLTLVAGTFIENKSYANENLTGLQKADTLFHWLESIAPQLLSPTPQETQEVEGIYYRYYPVTDVYIATYMGDLWFIDHLGGLHNLGKVNYWLSYAPPYPSIPSAEKIYLGQVPLVINGTIERGGEYWYSTDLDSGVLLTVYVVMSSRDVLIKIYDPDLNLIKQNNRYNSYLAAQTERNGTYYISLSTFDGNETNYWVGFSADTMNFPF